MESLSPHLWPWEEEWHLLWSTKGPDIHPWKKEGGKEGWVEEGEKAGEGKGEERRGRGESGSKTSQWVPEILALWEVEHVNQEFKASLGY